MAEIQQRKTEASETAWKTALNQSKLIIGLFEKNPLRISPYWVLYETFLKKENFIICNNMNETRGHYGRWNKPGTETNKKHSVTWSYLYVDKKVELIEAE